MKKANVNPNVIQTFTQNQAIKKHLLKGKKLNPLEALEEFGTMKLATRISELQKAPHNLVIEKHMITVEPFGKRVMEYRLNKYQLNQLRDERRREKENRRFVKKLKK